MREQCSSLCAHAGVIDVLTEALKDKNERVRRRIMATLGELLFYVATQQQVQAPLATSLTFPAAAWLLAVLMKPHHATTPRQTLGRVKTDFTARLPLNYNARSLDNKLGRLSVTPGVRCFQPSEHCERSVPCICQMLAFVIRHMVVQWQ